MSKITVTKKNYKKTHAFYMFFIILYVHLHTEMAKNKLMQTKKSSKKRSHIQVWCNTPFLFQLKQDIDAIADNKGQTTTAFVKDLLVNERDKWPEEKRIYKD